MNIGFRIGENLGILLGNLAQEKLLVGLDIPGSLSLFSSSLGIKDKDVLLKLLEGRESVLEINEEEQEAVMVDRNEESEYPILRSKETIDTWLETLQADIEELRECLKLGGKLVRSEKIKKSINLEISFDLSDFINIVTGNINQTKETLFNAISNYYSGEEEEYIYQIESLGIVLKDSMDWIEEVIKKIKVIDFIIYHDLGTIHGIPKDYYKRSIDNVKTNLVNIYDRLEDIMRILDLTDLLNRLVINIKPRLIEDEFISTLFSHVILPVEIEEGYDAGWLSPGGEFYGMNGEMSSMLHVRIAELLEKEGVVPINKEYTPDYWLEENGWVKIHGNWILFNTESTERNDLEMTEKQVEEIVKYGKSRFCGFLKFGYKQELMSVSNFEGLSPITRKLLFSV